MIPEGSLFLGMFGILLKYNYYSISGGCRFPQIGSFETTSQNRQPNDHTSKALDNLYIGIRFSGGKYGVVPVPLYVFVITILPLLAEVCIALVKPKSVILTSQSSSIRMFYGLRSLCKIPLLSKYFIPSAICYKISSFYGKF